MMMNVSNPIQTYIDNLIEVKGLMKSGEEFDFTDELNEVITYLQRLQNMGTDRMKLLEYLYNLERKLVAEDYDLTALGYSDDVQKEIDELIATEGLMLVS